jgi:hypothetical protein
MKKRVGLMEWGIGGVMRVFSSNNPEIHESNTPGLFL